MRILIATSEAAPYWKTGGLADVARELSDALKARGHEVLIVHPYYRFLSARGVDPEVIGFARLPWTGGDMMVRYLEDRPAVGAPTVFVDQPYFFDIADPYGPTRFDQAAAGRRFALFSRAVVERAEAWGADVVHLNDWPTGLVPAYAELSGLLVPTIFTIHNLGYQGNFPSELLPEIGVPWELYRTDGGVEFHGMASFLKAGLALSDRLVTVSPTYAREIQTPAEGAGLDGLLYERRAELRGILNGIDFESWNPETDPVIRASYSTTRLEWKERNRKELLHEFGLDGGGPIFVMVTRLVEQKGIELILRSLRTMVRQGVRLVVLGTGNPAYEAAVADAAAEFPGRVAAILRFDDELARRLYAGGDFFLMPSLYEPCGLGQMIAQRYGTPPIVRMTGGLADTVIDGVTGFAFHESTPRYLLAATARALACWRGPEWDAMRRRCMRLDHSWGRSAGEYEEVYREAIRGRVGHQTVVDKSGDIR
jgi:starch synthase